MIRTQIYITKDEKEALERLSRERNTTKSKLIREAIDQYVDSKRVDLKKKKIMDFAGIWKDKKDIPDVRELREGWGRRIKRIYGDDR